MCARKPARIESLTLFSASPPRLHSAISSLPCLFGRESVPCWWVDDHVPRSTLEQGCVFGNGFCCILPCGGTASFHLPKIIQSHRNRMRTTTTSLQTCARRLMRPSDFVPFHFLLLHSLHSYTPLRYDPLAGYARKRLIVAATRMRTPAFTRVIRLTLPLSLWLLLCASKPRDEAGRIRNKMTG